MTYNFLENSIYMTVREIAEITGKPLSTLKYWCQNNSKGIVCREVQGNGGSRYEILVSSLEPELREIIAKHLEQKDSCHVSEPSGSTLSHNIHLPEHTLNLTLIKDEGSNPPKSNLFPLVPFSLNGVEDRNDFSQKTTPEHAKKLALAKADLVKHWIEFREKQSNKKQADKAFLTAYNGKVLSERLYQVIGKVSIKTLYRWSKILKENNGDCSALVPSYEYGSESRTMTTMSPIEQKLFTDLMFSPSQISVGEARNIINYILKSKGFADGAKSYSTYKRAADKIKRNYYDLWVLMRQGEKAVKDKVAPYVMRDVSDLNVGDVLIADGNTLDFQVISPFNGKPCRATMIVYLDWKSEDVAGYEIMLTENVQCITSALRNSIIRLGKIPNICYQDNGAAFRSRFFTSDNSNFTENGFYGIFGTLGIIPMFAQPYNARAKLVERFFREFTKSCASLMPSYIGNCIDNKPAYLKRNEKFHKSIHSDFVPTIQQAVSGINKWLEYYRSRPCPNVEGKTIGEVFNEGRGNGVNIEHLDDLMMASEKRKIMRNGVRLFNTFYWSPELYGKDDTVVVKYSLLDISKVKIYSMCGDFICTATTELKVHAVANYLGDEKDVNAYKQAVKRNKNMIKQTMKDAYGLVSQRSILTQWQEIPTETQNKIPEKNSKPKAKHYKLFPAVNELPKIEEKKYKLF